MPSRNESCNVPAKSIVTWQSYLFYAVRRRGHWTTSDITLTPVKFQRATGKYIRSHEFVNALFYCLSSLEVLLDMTLSSNSETILRVWRKQPNSFEIILFGGAVSTSTGAFQYRILRAGLRWRAWEKKSCLLKRLVGAVLYHAGVLYMRQNCPFFVFKRKQGVRATAIVGPWIACFNSLRNSPWKGMKG